MNQFEEALQCDDEFDLEHYSGTMIHRNEDPDDYITIHLTNEGVADPTLVGGRGKSRKTHTGVIDAVHRTLGNLHTHPENGGNIRKTKPTICRKDRNETAEKP
jgi:hypothetical protein